MKRTMYYSMIRKYLLSLFFAFGLIFDAKCALRFTLDGVPHCITTGKHITINWPPEIKEVKEEGENLLQDAQAETEKIDACRGKVEGAIREILREKDFDSLKAHDKLMIGRLCILKDKLADLLLNKQSKE